MLDVCSVWVISDNPLSFPLQRSDHHSPAVPSKNGALMLECSLPCGIPRRIMKTCLNRYCFVHVGVWEGQRDFVFAMYTSISSISFHTWAYFFSFCIQYVIMYSCMYTSPCGLHHTHVRVCAYRTPPLCVCVPVLRLHALTYRYNKICISMRACVRVCMCARFCVYLYT